MMTELVTTKCDNVETVSFSDDFEVFTGKLKFLLPRWTTLLEQGQKFG